ncbi:hypothetical protein [Cytophaga aurantiaca]|uniref:hypothetical protein n=1 Tax=Cytophaga aurantiaca TaxID=29530 RepID=UPI0003617BAA|nr:hypothetical protein [Cytophaga aurantiaca]
MKANHVKISMVLFLSIILCLFNCIGKNDSYEANPKGLVYSSVQGGPGTSNSQGALKVNIRSDTYWSNYEKYTIHIDGLGDYTLPVNTIQFNKSNINPGTYTFQINVVCENGNNNNCRQRFIKGQFTVQASYTTVIDAGL